MAIYKVKSVSDLKSVGVKIGVLSSVLISSTYRDDGFTVPCTLKITRKTFKNCVPHTYNIEDNVIVVVISPIDVFIIPNIAGFQDILIEEGYKQDVSIYVPVIHEYTLERSKHKRLWYKAKHCYTE